MKLLLVFSLISMLLPSLVMADDYPGRAIYPKVKIYETEQLNQSFENVIIVDVRSTLEFKTLHINNAVNIPLNSRNFVSRIRDLRKKDKNIIFYCNGHSCYKSYKAANKARRARVSNVFSYDSGVFDWTRAHPDKATLLGNTPVNTENLISKEQFKKASLDPQQFSAKITDNTIILDIREPAQRGLLELFPYRQVNIPMGETAKLSKFFDRVKKSAKTLLVYDEAGKQVRWLQYYLQDSGINNYYFMKGGVKNFFTSLKK